MADAGYCDLHCHLLPGLDDGAKTMDDALEMARALVQLGFSDAAPSPHARPEYASAEVALKRVEETRAALERADVRLSLHPNAENALVADRFVDDVGTNAGRRLGAGRYVLVEAPYAQPVPRILEVIFAIKLKGVTPLFAHPERCVEFERKGRAQEVVAAGAYLQLDLGALIGRYGKGPRKVAEACLDEGLYAVAATDLHSPIDAVDWVGRSIDALFSKVSEQEAQALLGSRPRRILIGEPLD